MSNDIPPDPPHPTQVWEVLAVREGKTKPNPKGPGELTPYYVDFEGCDDGWVPGDGVFWRRKAGNAPEVGKTVLGTITAGQYGYSFRMSQDQSSVPSQASSQPRTPAFKAAAGQPPTGESQDARQRSIIRQHSQSAAIEFLKVCGIKAEPTPEWLELNLAPLIDWMVSDANGESKPSVNTRDDDLPF